MSKQRMFVIAAAAVGIISLFLPFASVTMLGITSSFSTIGTGALGYLLMVMFAVSLLLALLGKPSTSLKMGSIIGIIICAAIALLFLLMNAASAGDAGGDAVEVSLGIGFWLAMLVCVAMPVLAFVFKNK